MPYETGFIDEGMSLREDKQLAWDMELVNQTCIFKPSNFTLKTPSVFFLIYRISCLPAHHHFIYKDDQDKKRPMQDRESEKAQRTRMIWSPNLIN